MQGEKFLSAEQVLLTTLVVKLAVMAAAATMLVRFRRFRHILIFEHRPWPDRLVFALSLGISLSAGVAARLLLGYNAADLTLEGAFLAGLIDGPYAGVTVGALVGLPPLVRGEFIALPFAVGCGFAGGGLRELCPKESIWHFSPFVFMSLHRRAWQMLRTKLSGLLRRLLRSTDHFVTLREELESIDEYLDIEVVRFGPQLKVTKDVSADTLDVIVPSMILQPLVENSIKHGLSRKVGEGRITIRSVLENGHAIIEVNDDGLGMTEERLERALGGGIGLSNVNERLRTIYGASCQLKLTSVPGQGTCARVEIPELTVPERVTA